MARIPRFKRISPQERQQRINELNQQAARPKAEIISTRPTETPEQKARGIKNPERSLRGLSAEERAKVQRETGLVGASINTGMLKGDTPKEKEGTRSLVQALAEEQLPDAPIDDVQKRAGEVQDLTAIEAANQRTPETLGQQARNTIFTTALSGDIPTPVKIADRLFKSFTPKSSFLKKEFDAAGGILEATDESIDVVLKSVREAGARKALRFLNPQVQESNSQIKGNLDDNLKLMQDAINLAEEDSPLDWESMYDQARSGIFSDYGQIHLLSQSDFNRFLEPEFQRTLTDYENSISIRIPDLDLTLEEVKRRKQIDSVFGVKELQQ